MSRHFTVAAAITLIALAGSTAADAKKVRTTTVGVSTVAVDLGPPIQDCRVFFPRFPGFGHMNGARPDHGFGSFPGWYGECANWGAYSASGTAWSAAAGFH